MEVGALLHTGDALVLDADRDRRPDVAGDLDLRRSEDLRKPDGKRGQAEAWKDLDLALSRRQVHC
jgi:hypothetical protein